MNMKTKEIQIEDIWNDKKKGELKKAILSHSTTQSRERILSNRLLSIQYKLEDYIRNESDDTEVLKILDFVKMYLKVLNLSKKRLATYFEMRDSNLHKYLSGERKLNAQVALKLSTFSHTKPEQWYKVQLKNEMIELNKEKANTKEYEKYDYRNLVEV
ncbi:transcriptional regulator [Flavobacterium sp. GSP27]|jgi:plasmid maintenance system antidote protein VapI|uniref:Transcriptional regulator n=2 Tax=Flavobacteriaceae TaxID=49546 RepID=A0A432CGX4_9FLAO|nr:transcriptional regulator [Flavobacterium sp. LS1R10]RTY79167.1 transcriptional regulator [Flavobacterium sp. LS1P28]RTY84804.1 transcriptional regulator [Flavobacterium sp. ZB4P23]RTY89537.1 transcriptional regulator [Flavobacterium sp. GSN2]RTZ01914.1 transcriptional regulator [Flavobacterium sp. GSP6]RTZ02078.1 transcriptional regulator [Flavobacterium bomense]RTZ10594.1 transcriptional regulator [Flavobacterium sp. GSP27]